MSIVVAVRKKDRICMCANSATKFPGFSIDRDSPKAKYFGNWLVSSTGWTVYTNVLDNAFQRLPKPEGHDQNAIYAFFLEIAQLLRSGEFGFVSAQCNDDNSPFIDLDATFLIVTPSGIFRVDADLAVTRWKKYCAIGSGLEFALGALYNIYDTDEDPVAIAEQAVQTAIELDSSSKGTVQTVEYSYPLLSME